MTEVKIMATLNTSIDYYLFGWRTRSMVEYDENMQTFKTNYEFKIFLEGVKQPQSSTSLRNGYTSHNLNKLMSILQIPYIFYHWQTSSWNSVQKSILQKKGSVLSIFRYHNQHSRILGLNQDLFDETGLNLIIQK